MKGLTLGIYGEIGVDWLVDRNGFIQSRWGGAGLYAAVAAVGKLRLPQGLAKLPETLLESTT